LNLDTAVRQVGASVQGVERLLQRESVRYQGLEIEDAAFQTLEAGRPYVAVAIDEFEVDLVFLISTDD
jgi:tRNA nucleotidyltransferase (CCA-adding enzyme)